MDSETRISFVALAFGLCAALFLVFANLSLAYLAKLFTQGSAPAALALLVFTVTLANGAVLVFLLRRYRARFVAATPRSRHESGHAERHAEAERRVLELARNGPFNIEDVMLATRLERVDSEYLLDRLLERRDLRVELEGDTFVYRSTTTLDL